MAGNIASGDELVLPKVTVEGLKTERREECLRAALVLALCLEQQLKEMGAFLEAHHYLDRKFKEWSGSTADDCQPGPACR